jgi:signal transduction histidine kinase
MIIQKKTGYIILTACIVFLVAGHFSSPFVFGKGNTVRIGASTAHENEQAAKRELSAGSDKADGRITPAEVMQEYRYWVILALLMLAAALLAAVFFFGLNRKLYAARVRLQEAQANIEEMVLERTAQLRAMNEELEQEIADRVRIEREKLKLQKQLNHVQKMEAIGVLAGGVAHDFNNILTAIIGYGTLALKAVENDPKVGKYLENILTASSRAVTLTRGLLTFSRKQVLASKPDDLNSIVLGVEGLLASLVGETIEYKMNLTDAEMIIMVDSGQIGQVIVNLATNAKDAMPEGGVFTIATSVVELAEEFFNTRPNGKPGKYAALSVTDTGTGMDADTRERIFDPFFTTKEVGKGTGLGLAVVFGIVEQHEGFLTVLSHPGKGTTFTLYLPME